MSDPTAAAPTCYRHPGRETWIRCQRCDRPICPDCMNSAAVGFQCPSCIKEGAKSTRSGRLPYGGGASANGALITFVLIGINVAVWILIQINGGNDSVLAYKLGITPDFGARPVNGGAVLADGVASGSWWQVITSVFTHIAPTHVALNMLALYFIGPAVETVLGRARYLTLYVVAGIAGSAGVMLFADSHQLTVGASGAIFGLLGALAVITMKIGGDWRNVLIWIGLNLALTFTLSNISWQGHLGGLTGGTLVALAFVYAPKANRTLLQFSGAGLVLIISLALIVLKAQSLPGIDSFLSN